eukprot:5898000-Pleurochrysis_carterae.AAC.2
MAATQLCSMLLHAPSCSDFQINGRIKARRHGFSAFFGIFLIAASRPRCVLAVHGCMRAWLGPGRRNSVSLSTCGIAACRFDGKRSCAREKDNQITHTVYGMELDAGAAATWHIPR